MVPAMDLGAIPFQTTNHPGIAIHFFRRDEDSGRTVVMIRMDPGCGYPAHTHRGFEEVLVLQGGYEDELGQYRAGDFVRYEDGSVHSPRALPGDHACILFATAERGVDVTREPTAR